MEGFGYYDSGTTLGDLLGGGSGNGNGGGGGGGYGWFRFVIDAIILVVIALICCHACKVNERQLDQDIKDHKVVWQ